MSGSSFIRRLERSLLVSRGARRTLVYYPVTFQGVCHAGEGIVTNFSRRGFGITSTQPLSPETYLSLRMSTPVSSAALMTWVDVPYDIDLAVVRWALGKEMGLEILRIQPKEQERLSHLIDDQSNIV